MLHGILGIIIALPMTSLLIVIRSGKSAGLTTTYKCTS